MDDSEKDKKNTFTVAKILKKVMIMRYFRREKWVLIESVTVSPTKLID